MKVFGRTITFPHRAREQFKGSVVTGTATRPERKIFYLGEHSWYDRCRAFDRIVEANALARQTILALGGQVIAEGIFPQPVTDDDGKTYPQAQRALRQVEDLNQRIKLKRLLFETAKTMGKYGSCFWEKTWAPSFDVRVIPQQECIEPAEQNEVGEITKWRQVTSGTQQTIWTSDEIVPLHFDVTSNSWPYGTSMLLGTDAEFKILSDLIKNSSDFMEKQAWPYEVLQLGDKDNQVMDAELQAAKRQWDKREVGENMITTVPSALLQGGTGNSPIRDLSNILTFVKDNLQDGMIMPAVSKLYNSTEASAKVLTAYAASCLIKPMQEIIRLHLEEDVYKPYLEDLGFSVKTCPTILFESPDAQKREEMEFWTGMVNAGICPPVVAAREFGWEDDWQKWQAEKKKQQEALFQKQKEQQKQDGKGQPDETEEEGKSWKVTELRTELRSGAGSPSGGSAQAD